jgi:hypothetical protein
MRKRLLKLLGMLAAAACLIGFVSVTPAPTASADALGNGYDVTCTQANGSTVTCNISGCPRVHEDLAGDVVHTKVNGGPQSELSKACGNTTTERINSSGAFTYSVQGCRKGFSDDCGAWSDYQYTPPPPPKQDAPPPPPAAQVDCPQGSPTPKAASLDQCAPVPPKTCPPGSAADTVPAGQQCQGPTNAVSMQINQEGINANATVTNNSALPAQCSYTATKTGGLVGPATVNRSVSVPANGSGNITDMLWPPPLVSYRATVKCTAQYDGKQVSIGESTVNVQG